MAPAPGMVIQYKAGRVHRALCLEPVASEGIPGTPSGRSSIVQTSPAKYNPFPRSALSLNTKFEKSSLSSMFYDETPKNELKTSSKRVKNSKPSRAPFRLHIVTSLRH